MTKRQWTGLAAIVIGWLLVTWYLKSRAGASRSAEFHDPSKGVWA